VSRRHGWTPPRSCPGLLFGTGPLLACYGCPSPSSKPPSAACTQESPQKHATSLEWCLWAPPAARERAGSPAAWVLSRRRSPTSRDGFWPTGGYRTTISLSPALAFRVLRRQTWLFTLKGTRQEFKELLLRCSLVMASSGLGFKRASLWLFLQPDLDVPQCTMGRRVSTTSLRSTHLFLCLC